MKNIKWLLTLADGKPLIFSLAILLIAVFTLSIVVTNRDLKIDKCNEQQRVLRDNCDRRIDSIATAFMIKERELNEKVESSLNLIIDTYRGHLEEQKGIADNMKKVINRNQSIINQNNNKIKTK